MSLQTLDAQNYSVANFSAIPSEKTPLFAKVDTLSDVQRQAITKKAITVLNKITGNVSLLNNTGFETHETSINNVSSVKIDTQKQIKGGPSKASDIDNMKATAIALAMLTQQDSITITRMTEQRTDDPSLNRGLSIDIGQSVDRDMANEIHKLAQQYFEPTLEFSVHGQEVRFVNFDPKMNREFISSVKSLAADLPVDSVIMKRFFVEGGKFENNYERRTTGQDYMHRLSDMGFEGLALQVKAAIPDFVEFIQEEVSRDQAKVVAKPKAVAFEPVSKKNQMAFDFGDMGLA